MKVIGARGQKIKRRTNVRRKKNPKRTRVARCVADVKRSNAARRRAHKKTVRSPIAVCQKSTRQSYASGRRVARKRASQGLRANPLPIRVGFKEGPPVALFRSLPRATQYAKALARHTGRQVRVQG